MAAATYAGHIGAIADCWSAEGQPTAYYRTTAARARRLQADATTPRVKQYLDKMIVRCERLAGKVEQPASRPLNRPGCVDRPVGNGPVRICGFARNWEWPRRLTVPRRDSLAEVRAPGVSRSRASQNFSNPLAYKRAAGGTSSSSRLENDDGK
jgi:hypothetical protein